MSKLFFPVPLMGAIKAEKWNPSDKSTSGVTLSNQDKTVTFSARSGIRSITSKQTGKLYFEMQIAAGSSYTGILSANYGLNTFDGTHWGGDGSNLGVAVQTFIGSAPVLTYGGTAQVSWATPNVAANDIGCYAVDFTNGRFWFRLNGGNWNNNASNNPATNVGGVDFSTIQFPPYFLYCENWSGASTSVILVTNKFTMPSGFTVWHP